MTAARDLDLKTLGVEQDGRVLIAIYTSPSLNFATTTFPRDLDRLTRAVDRDSQALELDLVHRVVPEQRPLAETQAIAARPARRSPIAIAVLKRSVYSPLAAG